MDVFVFAQGVKEAAKSKLIEDGKHDPLILCLMPKEVCVLPILMKDEQEKLRTLEKLKKLIKLFNVWAYVVITEGRMLSLKADDLLIKPSESPDSVKILMVSAISYKRRVAWSIPINKDDGKISFGKETSLDTEKGFTVTGLFMDLLPEIN